MRKDLGGVLKYLKMECDLLGVKIPVCVGGCRYYQEWEKEVQELHPGDVVNIPVGVLYSPVTHLCRFCSILVACKVSIAKSYLYAIYFARQDPLPQNSDTNIFSDALSSGNGDEVRAGHLFHAS